MVVEGTASATVTLRGFNFVRRSQVLFKGVPVPYKAVSGSELQVVIDRTFAEAMGYPTPAAAVDQVVWLPEKLTNMFQRPRQSSKSR